MSPLRAWLRLAAAALLLVAPHAYAQGSLEYAVKATYLYKFAPFVQWPDSAFASPESPITICVSGNDPFGAVLDQAVVGQRVGGRPVVVRRIASTGTDSGCHIVFVGGSREQPAQQSLDALRGQPVLTVTDNAVDPATTGIINFIIIDGHVRFEIDAGAATQNHIVISSKLLSLARRPGQTK